MSNNNSQDNNANNNIIANIPQTTLNVPSDIINQGQINVLSDNSVDFFALASQDTDYGTLYQKSHNSLFNSKEDK